LVNAVNQVIERGTWVDEVSRETIDGRAAIIRVVVVTEPDGVERERYRLVVDARTFVPIRSEWRGKGLSYAYDFDNTRVHGERVNVVGGGPTKIDAVLNAAAFDYYGGMMELFLATLPRVAGQKFTFPAALATSGAAADQSAMHWPLVEVIGEENARGAGGQAGKAWRLEANTAYGYYKVGVTDTAPYVVRTVLLLGPGGRITYELMPMTR